MKAVTIYTTKVCPYCVKAKGILRRNGLDYTEIDVSRDEDRLALVEKSGRKTVPQIYIGEHLVGGCDDLEAAEQSGALSQLTSG